MRGLQVEFSLRGTTIRAVDGVSFDLKQGRTVGIVGESGSGKSVTALSLMGLLPKNASRVTGSVIFEQTDLLSLGRRKIEDIRGRRIGMVFQDPMSSLNPIMRVGTQLQEVLRRHFGMGGSEARIEAVELLESARIPNASARIDDYPHQFSGGMRQRVMIAMAVACKPRLLIADEPTTALDVTVQAEILDILRDLKKHHQMAMILITHDMGVIAEMANEVIVMYAGQVVERAPATEFFRRPEHPYSEALFGAMPQLEGGAGRHGRFQVIPGQPPDLLTVPAGCRFAARCPYADLPDTCGSQVPELRLVRPRHWVRSEHPASERPALQPATAGAIRSASPAAPGAVVLEVRDLKKHYRHGGRLLADEHVVRAIDGISFEVRERETLGLVGESGSGKSTTALCLLQLVPPTSGSVRFKGKELVGLPEGQLRGLRSSMQIVFQDPYASLDPRMSVGDIVAEPMFIHRLGSRAQRQVRVRELLDIVGLGTAYASRFPHELSGGQRQRVGIARALALRPQLIICDEPVSALDVSIQAQVLNLLKDLQDEFGLTYVFISHDLAVVRSVSDRLAVMQRGKIIESGPADTVYRQPTTDYARRLLAAVPDPRPQGSARERSAL